MRRLALILLLSGCASAEKLYNKAKNRNVVTVARLASVDFPCVTTERDTVRRVDTIQDIIAVDCPDSVRTVTDTITGAVTQVRVPVKVYVPRYTVVRTNTITIAKRDSATIFVCLEDAKKAAAERDKYRNRSERRGDVILYLIIALLISVGLNLFKFMKR